MKIKRRLVVTVSMALPAINAVICEYYADGFNSQKTIDRLMFWHTRLKEAITEPSSGTDKNSRVGKG